LQDKGFLRFPLQTGIPFSYDNPIGLSRIDSGLGDFFAALPYFLP
jgi:hypothetical protein